MKNLLTITLLFLGINFISGQTNISIEAKGNLESPKPCGCVALSEVTIENNPADILTGMGKCIEQKQFEKAARLFAIAGVYGRYDAYRVKDKTAHQALLVLQQNILGNIDESDKTNLIAAVKSQFKLGSKELSDLCLAIQLVGIPKYYPKYMIQHGIQAFTENEGNGLIEGFNSEESWNLALKSYLHCGE